MATPNIIQADLHVRGKLTAGELDAPAGSIDNAAIAAGSPSDYVAGSKIRHRFSLPYRQGSVDKTPADETVITHVVRGTTGTVVSFRVVMQTAPTGGDKKVTVDLKVGGASILTAAVEYDSDQSDLEIVAGTLDTTALALDDVVTVVVATSGTTGTQGEGLFCEAIVEEDPV